MTAVIKNHIFVTKVMQLPTSPMMGGSSSIPDPTRGTSVSLSLHSSVNEAGFHSGKSLKKTNTQVIRMFLGSELSYSSALKVFAPSIT